MKDQVRGVAGMSAAMAISGTIGWVVVSAGEPLPRLLFWRCCLGAASLLVFCAVTGRLAQLPLRVLALSALGGVALVGNWMLLFASYSHASISLATIVYNTQPFLLLLLAALLLGERLARGHLGWLLVAFAGVALIAQARPQDNHGDHRIGLALALGAAFLYAVAALATKKLKGTPPQLVALVQMCVGTLMLVPWAAGTGFLPRAPQGWAYFATLGLVHTGIMYILLYGAIQKLPTPTVAVLSFIYPLVALLVDHLVLHVRFEPLQWVGASLVIVAVLGLHSGGAIVRRVRKRAGREGSESAEMSTRLPFR